MGADSLSFGGSGRSKSRRKPKSVRLGERPTNLIFGLDIEMEQVVSFSELSVVARARGRCFGMPFLKSWVKKHWGGKISTDLTIRILARGWFSFSLGNELDVSWVLNNH